MIRVREATPEIESFNAQVTEAEHIRLEAPEPVALDMSWRLPDEYKNLNLDEHIARAFGDRQAHRHSNH